MSTPICRHGLTCELTSELSLSHNSTLSYKVLEYRKAPTSVVKALTGAALLAQWRTSSILYCKHTWCSLTRPSAFQPAGPGP
jgi:hypothetical protein